MTGFNSSSGACIKRRKIQICFDIKSDRQTDRQTYMHCKLEAVPPRGHPISLEGFFFFFFFFFFDDATARGGPWPPLQYASKPLDPLLCLSIRLFPSFSGPWTRHPSISFLVVLFVLLHTAFCTSFLELRCLAFFLCDQAIVFFVI